MSKKKAKQLSKKRKEKESEKLQEQEENIDEIVDEIYDDEESGALIKPIRYGYTSRFISLLAVLLVSFLAGVVGELVINNYLHHKGYAVTTLWQPVDEGTDGQQVIIFKKEEAAEQQSDAKALLDATQQAVVGIYQKRGGDSLVDQVYQPRDKIGNALVLTSDGWLVTTTTGMPTEPNLELVVMSSDNQLFDIEKIVLDTASQVVFLKIQADNLKVIKFADSGSLYSGLPVFVVGQTLTTDTIQSVRTAVEQTRYQYVRGFGDYFGSSEQFSSYAKLAVAVEDSYAGSPVVDLEGGIVGLYYGSEDVSTVIPAKHFTEVFNDLLKFQKIERPYFGIRYLDLTNVVGIPQTMSEGLHAGALIFGDDVHGVEAVAAGSPADEAGLELGDIILSVNNDIVNVRHSLPELLQQYRIGDVVTVTVQNSGEKREVEIPLVEPLEAEAE